MEQKQSNESLVRERDFYRSKFEGMEKKIKSLKEVTNFTKWILGIKI